ncbi:MAG: tRNA (guanosine(46)-N7)-methyltransferase TrmB [Firmicutes bacterium]|nr:tRNA (guanosine(46)-N7)-methyltransferase TrmB [Bacillota bacterium]
MRLRTKPNALDTLLKNQDMVIFKPNEYKGKWNQHFNNTNPIYVELGTGKGKFIVENAKKSPNINFIGIDAKNEVLYMALKKALEEKELTNLALLPFNIENIEEVFDYDEVNRLFINFPDPWPKARHEKRRLTNIRFLQKYKNFLESNSLIILKTDNKPFFDYSLEEFKLADFKTISVTYDLKSEKDLANILTEYELKFMEKEVKINRLICTL